jgi:hypothetical protein
MYPHDPKLPPCPPELFRHAVRAGGVKGGGALGGATPLLPWMVQPESSDTETLVIDENPHEQHWPQSSAGDLPKWLGRALENTSKATGTNLNVFRLRKISPVGSGFGHGRPW